MTHKIWTEEDIEMLRCMYENNEDIDDICLKLNRTKSSIYTKANELGIHKDIKKIKVGDVFNYLTVIEILGEGKYRCRCICGSIKDYFGNNLTRNHTKSCGCKKSALIADKKIVDLTGLKFGKWTVLYFSHIGKDHQCYWHCRCECGTEKDVSSHQLTSGKSQSCGCLLKDINRKNFKKYNEYEILGKITFVKYSNCEEWFICDTEDWNKLLNYCWRKENEYAVAYDKSGKDIRMHRIIMNCPADKEVDHIYQVSCGVCDNRKSNLRICSIAENNRNRSFMSNNTSGVIGVNWDKNRNKWMSRIEYKGKTYHLGRYEKFEDAVKSRLKAEKEYFGEFAPQRDLFDDYGVIE